MTKKSISESDYNRMLIEKMEEVSKLRNIIKNLEKELYFLWSAYIHNTDLDEIRSKKEYDEQHALMYALDNNPTCVPEYIHILKKEKDEEKTKNILLENLMNKHSVSRLKHTQTVDEMRATFGFDVHQLKKLDDELNT